MEGRTMRIRATRAAAIAALVAGSFGGTFEAGAEGVSGRIVKVTLYRGQALVTREVPIGGAAGPAEVAVSPLPERIVPDSLFAEGGSGVEVRAVRFRARAVGEEPREELRKLDQEQEALQAKIDRNHKMAEVLAQRQAYLDKLETFVAPTATVELSKGVLNAETLQKLALFSFDQRKASAEEALKLAAEQADLKRQQEFLKRRRAEVSAGTGKTLREAVLFIEKRGGGAATVRLNYLVQHSGWSPAYNFYAASDAKEIRVEYNALIHQQTGEDWAGVDLTLSTAFPSLTADAPGLAPFRVALSSTPPKKGSPGAAHTEDELSGLYGKNVAKLQAAGRSAGQAYERGDYLRHNWDMNDAANTSQFLELATSAERLRRAARESAGDHEGLAVNYPIPGPVGLASRPDQQLVRIFDAKLPAAFFHVATPLLTHFVYRQADVKHTGAEALLGGPCSVYLDGRFVGRGEIPSVSRGESFVIGCGTDSQLRARRELADRKESVQGGNREVTFKYRLVLENFKETPVAIRVLDRLPVAHGADIRITLGELKDKLSEDPLYLRVERPKGILRWDIEAPARSAGEKARLLEFGYRLEFDRNLVLASPDRVERQQEEFMEMQKARQQAK
jgi:hypothetical protein